VAEETSNQRSADASSMSADRHPGIPAPTYRSRAIDMSAFETLMAEPPDLPLPIDVADIADVGDVTDAAACRPGLPQQRPPSVEWAIIWGDGRLTAMETEAAARFVAARSPATRVACRIVGQWGPSDLP
jgi:hypothetical protein